MRKSENKRAFHRRHLYSNAEAAHVIGYSTEKMLRFLRRKKVPLIQDGRNYKVTRADLERVLGAAAPHVIAELDANYG